MSMTSHLWHDLRCSALLMSTSSHCRPVTTQKNISGYQWRIRVAACGTISMGAGGWIDIFPKHLYARLVDMRMFFMVETTRECIKS